MQINRYWICDSSGSGKEDWQYFIGQYVDIDEAREGIYNDEPWSRHVEHTLVIELDVKPPVEFLIAEHKRVMNKVTQYQKIANNLANKIHEAERNA